MSLTVGDFPGKVVLLGYGSVAQCALPLLVKHIDVPLENVTVIDFEDKREALRPWLEQGVNWQRDRITPTNLGAVLGSRLSAGDVLIDLAWNIDCREILGWCHDHGVLYLNTSVEEWDPDAYSDPAESTLYRRHMEVRDVSASWSSRGPTAVIEHGANPGLISHWTKQGLVDIAESLLDEGKAVDERAERLTGFVAAGAYNLLARDLGVKVIHCSERDTQVSADPKEVNEFVNTWSVEGFREEGCLFAELGWGTHEQRLPEGAGTHSMGPGNQIFLPSRGMNTWVRSWVPDYRIHGMVIRHGEAFTISDYLTVWEDGRPAYRPTVHYAYCPADVAIASLQELRSREYEIQPAVRILSDEIVGGADILGALLMGHEQTSWWTGSDLTIEESRRLVPHQNATTLQVAISVIAAVSWMIANPDRGLCRPEDLPHEDILGFCAPYLGANKSVRSDWRPTMHSVKSLRSADRGKDIESWQFSDFQVDY